MGLNEYDIENAFKSIEGELMDSMIRNMKRHRIAEVKEEKQWAMWQAEQLRALEKYKVHNRKRFTGSFSEINQSIGVVMRAAKQQGSMNQEVHILQAIKKGFKVTGRNKSGPGGTNAEFFKLNDRKLEALIKATQEDFKKAETAVLRMANDQYRKIIFSAQVYANTGAGTYEQAVDMATKDFLSRGLNCIEYANGARHTVASYAAMAIQTASKRAYLQGEGEKRKEWGVTMVILNKRGNACPKCLPFVGKVLIDDVWSGGKQSDGAYMLMSTAIQRGLYHPNCKDVHTTYFPGISAPEVPYTEEELKQIEEAYREEQKLKYASRQADKYARLVENTLDEDDKQKYQKMSEKWKNKVRECQDYIFGGTRGKVSSFITSLSYVEDENVRYLLNESGKRTPFKLSDNKKSYYNKNIGVIRLAASADSGTIAHELFHEIDAHYGITKRGILHQSIQNDYRSLQMKSIGYGKSIEDMLYFKYKDAFETGKRGLKLKPEYRGVSDILNGMSDGNIRLGFIHSKEYWKRSGALEAETWAQFGRVLYHNKPEVLEMLNFVCSETYTEVLKTLKEMT